MVGDPQEQKGMKMDIIKNSLYGYKNHSYKSKNTKFKGKVTINPIIPVLLNMSSDVRDQAIISSQTLTINT